MTSRETNRVRGRRPWPRGLLSAALLAVGLGAPGAAHAQVDGIGLLGDSLTTGYHTSVFHPVGFAYLVRNSLPYPAFLMGCAGSHTENWANGVPRTCTFIDPDEQPDPTFSGPLWVQVTWAGAPLPLDMLVIFFGTNDAIAGIQPAEYGANMQSILDHVFENEIAEKVYLVKPSLYFFWPQLDDLLLAYGQEIDALAAADERVIGGIDLSDELQPAPRLPWWPHSEVADKLGRDLLNNLPKELPGLASSLVWTLVGLLLVSGASQARRGA